MTKLLLLAAAAALAGCIQILPCRCTSAPAPSVSPPASAPSCSDAPFSAKCPFIINPILAVHMTEVDAK